MLQRVGLASLDSTVNTGLIEIMNHRTSQVLRRYEVVILNLKQTISSFEQSTQTFEEEAKKRLLNACGSKLLTRS